MSREISNMDDVIDSRDVIARIDALRDEYDPLLEQIETAQEDLDSCPEDHDAHLTKALDEAKSGLQAWEADNKQELDVLLTLQEEAEGSPDWRYGEVLIRYSYFKDYAQELAEDCGLLENANTWPGRCIDWDQAAEELKMDYFSVDFDGVEYLIRS